MPSNLPSWVPNWLSEAAANEGLTLRLAPGSKTGYRGVKHAKGAGRLRRPFEAQLTVDRRKKYLGHFSTAEEAALAYARGASAREALTHEVEGDLKVHVDAGTSSDGSSTTESESNTPRTSPRPPLAPTTQSSSWYRLAAQQKSAASSFTPSRTSVEADAALLLTGRGVRQCQPCDVQMGAGVGEALSVSLKTNHSQEVDLLTPPLRVPGAYVDPSCTMVELASETDGCDETSNTALQLLALASGSFALSVSYVADSSTSLTPASIMPIQPLAVRTTSASSLVLSLDDCDDESRLSDTSLASPVADFSLTTRTGSAGSTFARADEMAGTRSRYQCRYPGCGRLYLSTDAARKHCRKSHFEWLQGLDAQHVNTLGALRTSAFSEDQGSILARLPSTHQGGMRSAPKPATYCTLVAV